MNFNENQLKAFAAPLSDSEEDRCKNAIRMVRDAMKIVGYSDDGREIYRYEGENTAYALELRSQNDKKIFLLVQGSYANNTNVRTQSDVDVAVILESTFIPAYREGVSGKEYGFSEGTFTAESLKNEVETALKTKFGSEGIERGDKSIKVHGNTYRVDADVVPAYRYRDYKNDYVFNSEHYVGGVEIRPDSGGKVINYPEQHIKNGKVKNNNTGYKYKKLVRIMKKIRYLMKEQGYGIPASISSFGLESLIWNIPNSIIIQYTSLGFSFENIISYLKNDFNNFTEYKEANGIKKLMDSSSKKNDYMAFINMLNEYFKYDHIP